MQQNECNITILTRKQSLKSTAKGEHIEQNQYLFMLEKAGLALSPKVYLAQFELENGLRYVGMAAKESIGQEEVLIRVPQQLILNSVKALEQQTLREVYQDCYCTKNNFQYWQDRVIIVYCLYLLQLADENNMWYQMIQRFPKQCDIACFWPQNELDSIIDKTVKSAAFLDLKSFQQQWSEFQQCQKRHSILQAKSYNKENYKRIFVNLMNRSFGKTINFVSMVPCAQLFNHHCSNVHYFVEKEKQTYFYPENVQQGDEESSNQSQNSHEYIEEGEFAYDKIQIVPYNWQVKQSFEITTGEKEKISELVKKLLESISNELNWQDFTVNFVGHLIEKVKIIQHEYIAGRVAFLKAVNDLKIIEESILKYIFNFQEYSKQVKKIKSKYVNPPKIQNFSYPKYKKQYQSFIIKTGKGDYFQKNNQIYFCYGRNSNRNLLLRYGFAIQNNKYQHVWISFNIIQCLEIFPDVLQKIMEKGISLLRKFKIKRNKLNMDLIIFFRLNSWNYYHISAIDQIFNVVYCSKQVVIIQQILSILQDNLNMYHESEINYNLNLANKDLNYHQYFIAVYHREKYRILAEQAHLMKKIIELLNLIISGQSIQKAQKILTSSEAKILKYYISTIK